MPPLGPALDKLQGAEHGLGWACGSSRSVNQCTSRSLSGELNVQRKDKLAAEKELQADMQEQVATHEISSDHQGAGNVVQDLHGTASRSDAAATGTGFGAANTMRRSENLLPCKSSVTKGSFIHYAEQLIALAMCAIRMSIILLYRVTY